MSICRVAIVGRPNVGKSSLLNWLSRRRISVVDPTAGVTRDRVTFLIHERDRYFELVDTGGIGIVDADDLSADIEQQIQRGIDEAAVILFVVDGKSGLAPLDLRVAERLRGIAKPVALIVNKCDSPKVDFEAAEFHQLGGYPLLCTSVLGDRNRQPLLDLILQLLPPPAADEPETGAALAATPELKLAIVGRRNVGKSTFINALAHTERMIVSEIPGTTRDSVDVRFDLDGKSFVAIDTPGVRKRKSLANDIEFYGLVRAQRSIRRADVVFMFFDAVEPISRVDKQLVGEIDEQHKPCVFVVNKWDLGQAQGMTTERWADYLGQMFPTMKHIPVAFITAKADRNTKQLINLAQSIYKQARIRVSTSQVNQVVRLAIKQNPPSSPDGKRLKVYFATQIGTEPPTFVLKCNYPERISKPWLRYLTGVLRTHLPFAEVPIKLYLRSRTDAAPHAPSLEDLPPQDLEAWEDRDESERFHGGNPDDAAVPGLSRGDRAAGVEDPDD